MSLDPAGHGVDAAECLKSRASLFVDIDIDGECFKIMWRAKEHILAKEKLKDRKKIINLRKKKKDLVAK